MKALILEDFKKAYQLKEIATPVPGKGQVLVRIGASAVNPLDIKIKAGLAAHAEPALPAILGIDMAGVVEAIGEGVQAFKPGDEIYGMTGGIAGIQGSLAEYAAVDVDLIAPKPKNISMREAAALPLSVITAWEGLIDRAHTDATKTVLIQGGAGGVGHIAVQLAKAMGATVFATVAAKDHYLMQQYGVVPVDYEKYTAAEYIKTFTNNEGFDIIFDTLGGPGLDASFTAAKQYTGHVISILGWGTHHLAPLSFRGATYSGVFTLYPLISGKGRAHHGDILRQTTLLVESGKLKPLVDPTHYNLETIAAAYRALESRTSKGKIVIDIR